MKTKIIYVHENGELKLTKEELDKLLDDAYNEGYSDGAKTVTPWQYGKCIGCPYKGWTYVTNGTGITATHGTRITTTQNNAVNCTDC